MSEDEQSNENRAPASGRPQRAGDEAPYTSESFEVAENIGTDSPLGAPGHGVAVPQPDRRATPGSDEG